MRTRTTRGNSSDKPASSLLRTVEYSSANHQRASAELYKTKEKSSFFVCTKLQIFYKFCCTSTSALYISVHRRAYKSMSTVSLAYKNMRVDPRVHKIMIMIVSKGIFAPPSQNLSASVAAMRGLYLIVLSGYALVALSKLSSSWKI